MAGRRLTDFEQVLLGLIAAAPSTGYDLKQHFAATPMGVYQPSSGALYPALRRLELRGLLLRAEPEGSGQARPRFVYHLTEQGRTAHAAWVSQPVNPATIAADLPLHLMRFVMMEPLLSRAAVLGFLADLRDALASFLAGLENYAASAGLDYDGRHTALALDHGISMYDASLAWTKRTINILASQEPELSSDQARPSRRAATSRPAAP
jgi:DNA-binding PadR family transcriptional regulator